MSILRLKKIPTSRQHYVGVEIEFLTKVDRLAVKRAVIKANLQNYVNVKNDGSIDEHLENCSMHDIYFIGCTCGYIHTHEITLLAPQDELQDLLKTLGGVLKSISAVVNRSCGLHVHLDMRHRNMSGCVQKLLKHQKNIHNMVHPNRKNSEYCRPQNPDFIDRRDRYRDINLAAYEKFNTIEVRIHEGTVDTNDIYKWCKYLINVVDGKNWSKSYVKTKTTKNKTIGRNIRRSERNTTMEHYS
jgi:hypothetical protein